MDCSIIEDNAWNGIKYYYSVMDHYTMGTGGGSGMPENHVIWQERDDTKITGYFSQIAEDLYLSVVHMWDCFYDYPFASTCKQIHKN